MFDCKLDKILHIFDSYQYLLCNCQKQLIKSIISEDIKNKIPEASDEAKKALDDIQKNLSKGFILDSYDEFIKSNNLADESLINFLKDANYGTKDLANYQQYLKDTGKATSIFSGFTQKASVALKSFGATLASIGINWAIGEIISLAIKGFDNLAHSEEHCKERVDSLMDSYKDAMNTAKANVKAVESIADRYEELSKGVNTLGENVSLTTDEYAEYNKIVNQIAEMFPQMVQGYTDEGNK